MWKYKRTNERNKKMKQNLPIEKSRKKARRKAVDVEEVFMLANIGAALWI